MDRVMVKQLVNRNNARIVQHEHDFERSIDIEICVVPLLRHWTTISLPGDRNMGSNNGMRCMSFYILMESVLLYELVKYQETTW